MSCSNDGGGGRRKEEEMLSSFPPIHTDTRTKKTVSTQIRCCYDNYKSVWRCVKRKVTLQNKNSNNDNMSVIFSKPSHINPHTLLPCLCSVSFLRQIFCHINTKLQLIHLCFLYHCKTFNTTS